MKYLQKIALSFLLLTLFSFSVEKQNNIVIYLIGDSTVCTQPDSQAPVTGWGTPFAVFFNPTVKVENHAKGGRSTRTFLSEEGTAYRRCSSTLFSTQTEKINSK